VVRLVGFDTPDTSALGESKEPQPPPEGRLPERRGLRALFGAEHLLKRQFVGGNRRPSIPTVMVYAFNIMQDRIARARLNGNPPDVMINPRLAHVGGFDFHRAQEAIEMGARGPRARWTRSVKRYRRLRQGRQQ
jgi:NTE family protein